MEMRLPPPPVASSWHVPLNLNAFASLDDDASYRCNSMTNIATS